MLPPMAAEPAGQSIESGDPLRELRPSAARPLKSVSIEFDGWHVPRDRNAISPGVAVVDNTPGDVLRTSWDVPPSEPWRSAADYFAGAFFIPASTSCRESL